MLTKLEEQQYGRQQDIAAAASKAEQEQYERGIYAQEQEWKRSKDNPANKEKILKNQLSELKLTLFPIISL